MVGVHDAFQFGGCQNTLKHVATVHKNGFCVFENMSVFLVGMRRPEGRDLISPKCDVCHVNG